MRHDRIGGFLTGEIDAGRLVERLLASAPAPLLAIAGAVVAVVLLAIVLAVFTRVLRGDRFETPLFKLERPERLRVLEDALAEMERDGQLKTNVLWIFKDRLAGATRLFDAGLPEADVRAWCRLVLIDAIGALSRGGHDRHRASIWVRRETWLAMYAASGFRQEAIDEATLSLDSIAGLAILMGVAKNCPDVRASDDYLPKRQSGPAYASLLAEPIKRHGATRAVLCIDAQAVGYFDEDDEFLASCFADLIGVVLTGRPEKASP